MTIAEIHRLPPPRHPSFRAARQAPAAAPAGWHATKLLLAFGVGYVLAAARRGVGPEAAMLAWSTRDPLLVAIVHALIFAAALRPASRLDARFGSRQVMIACLLAGGAGAILIAAAPALASGLDWLATGWLAAIAGGALLCASSALVYASMSRAILRQVTAARREAAGLGLIVCGGLAATAATVPMDAIAAWLSGPTMLVMLAGLSVATAALVWRLLSEPMLGAPAAAVDPTPTEKRYPAAAPLTMMPSA